MSLATLKTASNDVVSRDRRALYRYRINQYPRGKVNRFHFQRLIRTGTARLPRARSSILRSPAYVFGVAAVPDIPTTPRLSSRRGRRALRDGRFRYTLDCAIVDRHVEPQELMVVIGRPRLGARLDKQSDETIGCVVEEIYAAGKGHRARAIYRSRPRLRINSARVSAIALKV